MPFLKLSWGFGKYNYFFHKIIIYANPAVFITVIFKLTNNSLQLLP